MKTLIIGIILQVTAWLIFYSISLAENFFIAMVFILLCGVGGGLTGWGLGIILTD